MNVHDTPFYHSTIKKYTMIVGTLFNNIHIQKFDENDVSIETIKVPLAYGPKDKMLRRIFEDSSITDDTKIRMTLPRISFELVSMTYDAVRKRNTQNRIREKRADSEGREFQYERVPYNFNYSVSLMTKYYEDSLQMVEQILPYFQPDVSVTVKDVPAFTNDLTNEAMTTDIPITLENITKEDEWEGDYETVRSISWNLDLVLKGYIYKPISKSEIILNADTNLFVNFDVLDEAVNILTEPEPLTDNPNDEHGYKFTTTDGSKNEFIRIEV